MRYDKKNLILGVLFLLLAVLSAVCIFTMEFRIYYATGLVLFVIIGLAFLRRAKHY